jgi:hypothetical protein
MATDLKNISKHLSPLAKELYQVPAGKTAIALNISIAPQVGDVKLYLFKINPDGDKITLIPNKVMAVGDAYSPPLNKLTLNQGDRLFAKATSEEVSPVRAIAWLGIQSIFNPSNIELADISLSIAEKTN